MQRTLTTIGLVLMGIVLVGSIVRAGQKFATGAGGSPPAFVPAAAAGSAPSGGNGVQQVALSFGRFNYTPDTIRVKRGVPVEIIGDMSKLRGCFAALAIPELNVWKRFTPTDNKLAFVPQRAGTFRFSCPMGMGSGQLIVEG